MADLLATLSAALARSPGTGWPQASGPFAGRAMQRLVGRRGAVERTSLADLPAPGQQALSDGQGGPAPVGVGTLIFEEDILKLRFLERVCRERGHVVAAHASPEAALETYQDQVPSLVVLGGSHASALLLCRRIQQFPQSVDTVIVIVGWSNRREDRDAAFLVGADDYLPVSANLRVLDARLTVIERNARLRAERRLAVDALHCLRTEVGRQHDAQWARLDSLAIALREGVAGDGAAPQALQQAVAMLERKVAEQGSELRALKELLGGGRASRSAEIETGGAGEAPRELRIPIQWTRDDRRNLRRAAPSAGDPERIQRLQPVGSPETQADPAAIPFPFRETLRRVLQPFGDDVRQNRLELSYHVAPQMPDDVVGDPDRIHELLTILVGNAIRFTREGEITVCVVPVGQTRADLVLLGSVADSGVGLTPEHQRTAFNALARGGEMARPTSGETHGLPMASHLVRSMGGRLWFESEVDQGSTFRFTLRLRLLRRDDGGSGRTGRHRAESGRVARAVDVTSVSVLLADDTPADCGSVIRVLEGGGHRIVVVPDGRQAVAAAEEETFDVALVNLRMPRMDGFECAAVIRTKEGPRGEHLPIIGISGTPVLGDAERCAVVGIDACVRKPLEPAGLVATIHRLRAGSVSEGACGALMDTPGYTRSQERSTTGPAGFPDLSR